MVYSSLWVMQDLYHQPYGFRAAEIVRKLEPLHFTPKHLTKP